MATIENKSPAADCSQVLQAIFKRLRAYERILRLNQLQIRFLTSELKRDREISQAIDTTQECLAALQNLGSTDDPDKCSMGICENAWYCPIRGACNGTTPTPAVLTELFPPLPTSGVG